MDNEDRDNGRGRGATYPHHVSVYEDAEGVAIINALARKRGLSRAALIRSLVREEAKRAGVTRAGVK